MLEVILYSYRDRRYFIANQGYGPVLFVQALAKDSPEMRDAYWLFGT